MMVRSQWLWIVLIELHLSHRANADDTFEMTWANQSFGPDGPWNAVQIQIGSEETLISLYPGGVFSSHVFTPSICNNASLGTVCYAQQSGLYNDSSSTKALFNKVSFSSDVDFSSGALQIAGTPPITGTDTWNIGPNMAPASNINMAIHTSSWGTLLDGTTYPLTVGSLALGAPGIVNQTFESGTLPNIHTSRQVTTSLLPDSTLSSGTPSFSPVPDFNATLLPGWLSTEAPYNRVKSNSFGLHIGSVFPSVTPSLYFGGFDQTRVLGNISTQQGAPSTPGSIDLLDVGFSVESGLSPWASSKLTGFLSSGNSSIGSALPVAINSLAPYLHLPQSTCDAIAAQLPVTYQPKYGIYFWNTADPQYSKIISCTASLAFTFRASESVNDNFTIKVPFKLLNLTLTAPLVSTPTLYFPCKAETKTNYQLGRAFLQAAFVGANWNANGGLAAWWLAQAPGPNTPTQPNPLTIGNNDTSITGSKADFAATWDGFWTPIPQIKNSTAAIPTSTPPPPDKTINETPSGLSTVAKIGIAVGVSAVIVAVLSGIFIWGRYRRNSKQKGEIEIKPHSELEYDEKATYSIKYGNAMGRFEAPDDLARYELHDPARIVAEAPAGDLHVVRYELQS